MSIEALIQAHIASLEANTEAVKLLTLSLAGRTPVKEAKAEKKNAEVIEAVVKEITKEEPIAKKLEESVTASGAAGNADTEVKVTSYEELRELVLRLASGGQREGIKAVSAKHGLGTPKDLLSDPNNYSSVANQATLEAVYADLQALEA